MVDPPLDVQIHFDLPLVRPWFLWFFLVVGSVCVFGVTSSSDSDSAGCSPIVGWMLVCFAFFFYCAFLAFFFSCASGFVFFVLCFGALGAISSSWLIGWECDACLIVHVSLHATHLNLTARLELATRLFLASASFVRRRVDLPLLSSMDHLGSVARIPNYRLEITVGCWFPTGRNVIVWFDCSMSRTFLVLNSPSSLEPRDLSLTSMVESWPDSKSVSFSWNAASSEIEVSTTGY